MTGKNGTPATVNQSIPQPPITAEIVCIGTELVSGHVVDTNSTHLAVSLATIGISVSRKTIIPDDVQQIRDVLVERARCTPLLIISGGLGPTEDDITCEAIATAFGRRLEPRSEIAETIQERFKHIRIPEDMLMRQALVPEGATLIENPVGTAPGVVLQEGGNVAIALPGVPGELRAMLPQLLQSGNAPTA